MTVKLAPSILNADFARLGQQVAEPLPGCDRGAAGRGRERGRKAVDAELDHGVPFAASRGANAAIGPPALPVTMSVMAAACCSLAWWSHRETR